MGDGPWPFSGGTRTPMRAIREADQRNRSGQASLEPKTALQLERVLGVRAHIVAETTIWITRLHPVSC